MILPVRCQANTLLKSEDKRDVNFLIIVWFGVRGSRSFGSLATEVNVQPFKIPSTSLINFRSISSETSCCSSNQIFRQFCKVADIFVKAPDVTYFWRPFECLKRELCRGVWGYAPSGNVLKRTPRYVVSSVSGNQVSVYQARLEFTQILFKK